MNVERLKPYYTRVDRPAPVNPVSHTGQKEEYEVEQLLNRNQIRGRTHYLVRSSMIEDAGSYRGLVGTCGAPYQLCGMHRRLRGRRPYYGQAARPLTGSLA